jgi:hypothetical protein
MSETFPELMGELWPIKNRYWCKLDNLYYQSLAVSVILNTASRVYAKGRQSSYNTLCVIKKKMTIYWLQSLQFIWRRTALKTEYFIDNEWKISTDYGSVCGKLRIGIFHKYDNLCYLSLSVSVVLDTASTIYAKDRQLSYNTLCVSKNKMTIYWL